MNRKPPFSKQSDRFGVGFALGLEDASGKDIRTEIAHALQPFGECDGVDPDTISNGLPVNAAPLRGSLQPHERHPSRVVAAVSAKCFLLPL